MDILAIIDKLIKLGESDSGSSRVVTYILVFLIGLLSLQTTIDTISKVWKIIKSWRKSGDSDEAKTSVAKSNDIRNRLIIDSAVYNVLKDAVEYEKINRSILFQFHNGVVMKSGMPFEYVVITHEAVSPGVAPSTLNGRHHDMRVFSELINQIIDGKVFISETESFGDPLRTIFHENGDVRICVKMICDILNSDTILGFLMYSNTKSGEFRSDIDDSITQASDRISGILSNTWGRCEFCDKNKTCKLKKSVPSNERCKEMVPTDKLASTKPSKK